MSPRGRPQRRIQKFTTFPAVEEARELRTQLALTNKRMFKLLSEFKPNNLDQDQKLECSYESFKSTLYGRRAPHWTLERALKTLREFYGLARPPKWIQRS